MSADTQPPRPSGANLPAIPALDGVRAIAITLVFVFHVYAYGSGSPSLKLFGLDPRPWLSTGFVGVYLFFVLSGFLLSLPWASAYHLRTPDPEIGDYFKRRARRIMPAYYTHIAVLFLIMVPIAYSFEHLLSKTGLFNVFAHLAFGQYLTPYTSNSFGLNGALWTLTIEAIFYLALPLTVRFFIGKSALPALMAAICLSALWNFLWQAIPDSTLSALIGTSSGLAGIRHFLSLQFPGQIVYFAMGIALANHHCALLSSTGPEKRRSCLPAVGLVATLAIMYLINRVDFWGSAWLHLLPTLLAAALGALVVGATGKGLMNQRVLSSPPARTIGRLSYGIYLWHMPVIYFVREELLPTRLSPALTFVFMMTICTLITLLISHISYTFIERPFLRQPAIRKSPDNHGALQH